VCAYAGHALGAKLQQLDEKREKQAKAVLEKNVEKALAYGAMRKRTAEDKAQAKKRKLEEANANVGGAKEKRKQRRNKGKKTAEKKQDDDTSSTSAMDEVKDKAAPVPEKED
jgi:hypothetical protein